MVNLLNFIPVLGLGATIATLIVNSAREWGWKRRRELRDELVALIKFEEEFNADGALLEGDNRKRKQALLEAAYVLHLHAGESALKAARKRAQKLRNRGGKRIVWAVIGAIVTISLSAVGFFVQVPQMPAVLAIFAVIFYSMLPVLVIFAVVMQVKDIRKIKVGRTHLTKQLDEVARVGSLFGPHEVLSPTEPPAPGSRN